MAGTGAGDRANGGNKAAMTRRTPTRKYIPPPPPSNEGKFVVLIVGHFRFFRTDPRSLSTNGRHRHRRRNPKRRRRRRRRRRTGKEQHGPAGGRSWWAHVRVRRRRTDRARIGLQTGGRRRTDPASNQRTVSRLCLCQRARLCLLANSTGIGPPLPLSA